MIRHSKKEKGGLDKTEFEKLRHCWFNNYIFFYKLSDYFSDAGYIACIVAANRLGVFTNDLLIFEFVEWFAYFTDKRCLYLNEYVMN